MRTIVAICLVLVVGIATAGEVPNLAKESNWGKLTQDGRKIRIEGDPVWAATGEIRADGLIYIERILISEGRIAHSVYGLDDKGELVGLWGFAEESEIDACGAITGTTRPDRIYSLKR